MEVDCYSIDVSTGNRRRQAHCGHICASANMIRLCSVCVSIGVCGRHVCVCVSTMLSVCNCGSAYKERRFV